MNRVIVIGTCGSGKTTLARDIAGRIGVPMLELDAIHWRPNWTPTPLDQLVPVVAAHVAQPRWTMDGNYGPLRDLALVRADTVIWLDYPFVVVFARLLRRTVRRCWTREELWNGNRERLWQTLGRDSLLWFVIRTWRDRRRRYLALLVAQQGLGKATLRFRWPRDAARWLASAPASGTPSPAVF
jgi:adenylate kinase family enzyme